MTRPRARQRFCMCCGKPFRTTRPEVGDRCAACHAKHLPFTSSDLDPGIDDDRAGCGSGAEMRAELGV